MANKNKTVEISQVWSNNYDIQRQQMFVRFYLNIGTANIIQICILSNNCKTYFLNKYKINENDSRANRPLSPNPKKPPRHEEWTKLVGIDSYFLWIITFCFCSDQSIHIHACIFSITIVALLWGTFVHTESSFFRK